MWMVFWTFSVKCKQIKANAKKKFLPKTDDILKWRKF